MDRSDFNPASRLTDADGTTAPERADALYGSDHPDPAAVTEGSGDPLDRGTGRRASGGGLKNADFVPGHGEGPASPDDLTDDGRGDSPLEKIKQAVGLSSPRGKELDDEMQRPPDRRSPLT